MPLEGQWRRAQTPLRGLTRRERNVAIAAVGAVLVALAILIAATAGDSRPGPQPGCIRVLVAGRTGGEVVAACGREARSVCARSANYHDPRATKVLESCRQAGIGIGRSGMATAP